MQMTAANSTVEAYGVTGEKMPVMSQNMNLQGGQDFLSLILSQIFSTEKVNDSKNCIFPKASEENALSELEEAISRNGSLEATQLAAEMLSVGGAMLPQIDTEYAPIPTEVNAIQRVENPLLGISKKTVQDTPLENPEGIDLKSEKPSPAYSTNEDKLPMQAKNGSSEISATVKNQSKMQRGEFLQQAREIVREFEKKEKVQAKVVTVDVEEIKKQVEAAKHVRVPDMQMLDFSKGSAQWQNTDTNEITVDIKDLTSQIETKVSKNIESKTNEFVIKLKPEGLGEITVKLLSENSKISLSIITQDEKVQRILSSEISSLREALRPLNAEVKDIVSQTVIDFGTDAGRQQNSQFTWQSPNERSSFPEDSESVVVWEDVAVSKPHTMLSALDKYI